MSSERAEPPLLSYTKSLFNAALTHSEVTWPNLGSLWCLLINYQGRFFTAKCLLNVLACALTLTRADKETSGTFPRAIAHLASHTAETSARTSDALHHRLPCWLWEWAVTPLLWDSVYLLYLWVLITRLSNGANSFGMRCKRCRTLGGDSDHHLPWSCGARWLFWC